MRRSSTVEKEIYSQSSKPALFTIMISKVVIDANSNHHRFAHRLRLIWLLIQRRSMLSPQQDAFLQRGTFVKKVAVILSGCGFYDGSEIQESVLSLLAIEQAGASWHCFAPDEEQFHVII